MTIARGFVIISCFWDSNVTIFWRATFLENYQTVLEAAVRWTISIVQKCSN